MSALSIFLSWLVYAFFGTWVVATGINTRGIRAIVRHDIRKRYVTMLLECFNGISIMCEAAPAIIICALRLIIMLTLTRLIGMATLYLGRTSYPLLMTPVSDREYL